ncbi:hypothetical protein LEP1GSC112_4306 [Leptospira interrogans serovar Pomona str. UT364]|uniref:Uncharacterized protein n=1 Tax=Leptospira interrogans serogroup Icterohaemorrhagiae serovar copenhageni (strain Fiocruz L1-130) TaxID=267671 RepID=Q72NL1_LEPIC|nr:conserved hypothetical protein [Leptospira interrogans serovar Copenhageni str. Fiocruz L1-130]EMN82129.1 hypothetical protein LEP1GSC106_1041 [Leptospira interrogans serovar Grippotyphosa str. UI 12764]EMN98258.1 hypothetical protein LEP1GSC112_4306 [Leptospira interrogans serovar Pomona str. UT364]
MIKLTELNFIEISSKSKSSIRVLKGRFQFSKCFYNSSGSEKSWNLNLTNRFLKCGTSHNL